MGSLEGGGSTTASFNKRDSFLRSSSSSGQTERNPFLQRRRSRFSSFFLFKRLDYLQWICTVAVFLIFVVLFQMSLPGSVVEKSIKTLRDEKFSSGKLFFLNEYGIKVLEKFRREVRGLNF